MKRYYIATVAVALVILLAFAMIYTPWKLLSEESVLKVGFIYDNDEITPYTYNFSLAKIALEKKYPERVVTYTRSNVLEEEVEQPLRELVKAGCSIIFTNSYSSEFSRLAADYPQVQICQTAFSNMDRGEENKNFHTFNGAIYQGRYVCGVVAGMKLRQLIRDNVITPEEAVLGYVSAFPTAEIISGYTAFLMGARSVVPETTMKVKYTGTWNNYNKEKESAAALIDAGCVIIGQHVDTVGTAVACEEAAGKRPVYHIGYNQSMLDVAPATSLISTRVNWVPYVTGAVEALMNGKPIEKYVQGNIHGNDIGAGFDKGWVEILEINEAINAEGVQAEISKTIEGFRRGSINVYRGNYTGVDPYDSGDTCDLSQGYAESKDFSASSFHYVLNDVITVLP